MRMSWLGVESRAMRPEMESISTPMKRAPAWRMAQEIAGAAAWFQDRRLGGHTEATDRLMDRVDDGRRCVEGVECGALGAVVFDGREQRLQFLADGLPSGVLVLAGDRVGEDREGDGTEAGEPGEDLFLLGGRGPSFVLEGLERADGRDDVAGLGFLAAGEELAGRRSLVEIRVPWAMTVLSSLIVEAGFPASSGRWVLTS